MTEFEDWPPDLFVKRLLEVTSGSMLGCILRAVFRDPRDYVPRFSPGAVITSDGYIMCGFTRRNGQYHAGALVGSVHDLTRNLIGVSVFAKLSCPEIVALGDAVDGWISTDYRAGASRPAGLILDVDAAKETLADLINRARGDAT